MHSSSYANKEYLKHFYGLTFGEDGNYYYWEENVAGKAATCTEDGWTAGVQCQICYEYVSGHERIPALGHDIEVYEAVEPTCSQCGYTEGSYCTRCGKWVVPREEIEPLPHTLVTDYGYPATYETEGLSDGSHCSVCNAVAEEQKVIPVLERPNPTGVTLDCTGTVTLNLGETLQLNATIAPEEAKNTLTWKSSSTAYATVNSSGLVTPVKEGTTTITVTTVNSKTASVKVTVVDPTKPTAITLDGEDTITLNIGDTYTLTYTLTPDTAVSDVSWSSSSTKIAKVSGGEVTAVAEGTATITAKTSKNSKTDTVKIKVVDPKKATAISLDDGDTLIKHVGDKFELAYTLTPDTATSSVSFTSGSTSIVKVNSDKTLSALKAGTATITAKTSTSKTDTIKITVHAVKNYAATAPTCTETGLTAGVYCATCDEWLTPQEEVPANGHIDENEDMKCDVCGIILRVPGDVDGNGTVNGRDSLMLLQYVAGWEVTINESNADVDQNGTVNGRDSLIMLQYIAGWDVTLK